MAYDEALADRVRDCLLPSEGISERKMFGGIAFMLNGNMVCGITQDDLMVRVGAAAYDEALALPGARPMDFNGRPMKGMLFVGPQGYGPDDGLAAWVERSLAFVRTLPPK